MRGQAANVGDTRVSPNGYHYTRTATGWRLTHHIVAERDILRRGLLPDERVVFLTKNRLDLTAANIQVVSKGKASTRRRIAQIEARIDELQAELIELRAQA